MPKTLGNGIVRSIATLIVADLAAEIAVVPEFRVRPAPVLRGMRYAPVLAPAQGGSVSPDQIGAPNRRVLSLGAHGGGSTEHDTARRSIHGRY